MADLEIEPQSSSFTGSIPSYPSSAPVQEELQRSSAETQATLQRTATLLSAIERQKESQRGAEAYIDLKEGLANIHEKTDAIPDLTLKKQTYDTARSALIDSLKQKHPNLSPIQGKSLVSALEDDRRVFHAKLATQGIANTKHDLSKLYDSSLRLAAMSKSAKEQDEISANFYNRLDSAKGIFSTDDIKDYKVKFGLNIKREQFASLAASKPDAILLMHPEDAVSKYGILPTDLLKYQNIASQIISNKHNEAEANLKGEQEKNLEWSWSHRNETGQIQQLGRTGRLPGGMSTADQITGTIGDKFPPDPTRTQGIREMLQHFSGGPEAFKNFYNKQILPQIYHMNSVDVDQIRGAYGDELTQRTSDFKNNAKDMLNDIISEHHRLMGDDGYGVNWFSGKMKSDTIAHMADVVRQSTARLNEVKSINEQTQIRDYYIKQEDEWFKKTWGSPAKSTTPKSEGTEAIPRE